MKTKVKILFLLTSLLCVTNVWAADTLYVNNTAALNKEQKDVLEYSRALLSAKGDKIALPIEVYSIVGITDKKCDDKLSCEACEKTNCSFMRE